MIKKIIIFGGTGFFGSAFLKKILKKKNYEVILVKRGEKLEINGEDFDIAIDFSSNISVDDFLENPSEMFLKNIEIPIKNMRTLKSIGFHGEYIYISTDRALVKTSNKEFINEITLNNDPYGSSKFISEIIVSYVNDILNNKCTIINFPNLYGPNQDSKQFIPTVLSNVNSFKSSIKIFSTKGNRNYLYIEDAVDALIELISSKSSERSIQISGENILMKNLLDELKKIYSEFNIDINFVEEKSNTIKRTDFASPPEIMNDSYFRKRYNWEPKFDIHKGLKIVIEKDLERKKINEK